MTMVGGGLLPSSASQTCMSRWRITRSIKLGGLAGSFLPRQPSGPSMVGLQEGPFRHALSTHGQRTGKQHRAGQGGQGHEQHWTDAAHTSQQLRKE